MAESKSPEIIAESWAMTPKSSKSGDFQVALKDHSKHRAELKDPRKWDLYSQILGNNMDTVIARSFGFTWADMDAYASWAQAVGGEGNMSLAIPYKNWAAMAPPEQEFNEMMAKHLKSEKKAKKVFERWQSHFESVEYNVYVLRTDLMP